MYILKKLILITLSVVYVQADYTFKQKTLAKYPVHPIAQECNKNAARIQAFMKSNGIFPMKFSDTIHNNSQFNFKKEPKLKISILPHWLILQNSKTGSCNCIVITE